MCPVSSLQLSGVRTGVFAVWVGVRLFGYMTEPILGAREIRRVVGEPTRYSAGARPVSLNVVTWNIAGVSGTNFEGVLRVLQNLDADVYLLQEVDMSCRRSGRRRVAQELADALRLNWIFAGEFQEIGESLGREPALTGQSILSRFPIEDPVAIRFAHQSRLRRFLNLLEPRRGGRMALRARTGGVVFYNAHLENRGDDELRRRQLDDVLVDTGRHAISRDPVVVSGDLNTSHHRPSPVIEAVVGRGFADALVGPRRTFVGREHPLDWVFVRGARALTASVANQVGASDHFPLQARLSLEPAKGP